MDPAAAIAIELGVTDGGAYDPAPAAHEFPTVTVTVTPPADDALELATWRADPFDVWTFDRAVDDRVARGAPVRLRAPAAAAPRFVIEVVTRCQRHVGRRTAATRGAWFDRVLAAHAALHDVTRPLVRADLDHALDTWQWVVRLDPDAGAPVQLAALLHDVERLATEADARIEHLAPDYQAFKDAHARAGAAIARALLDHAGVAADVTATAAALIARHERPADDPALALVADADALSFFALNSPGYVDAFGPAQARRKVAYTLARMSPRARARLPELRLRGDVAAMIDDDRHGRPHRA